MSEWHDTIPIYLQLRNAVVQGIVQGTLPEGEAVPSVRQVASDEKINPLTVSRAYQMLVDEQLLEKKRGLGMFVTTGAAARALKAEREKFLRSEWPDVVTRIEALGLSVEELLAEIQSSDVGEH